MKQKIRKGVFETNSSSTHSICIAKNAELNLPKNGLVKFRFGEFGWEESTLSSLEEKASYLYTGLIANKRENDIKRMVSILEAEGLKVALEEPIYKTHTWNRPPNGELMTYTSGVNTGYIDHADELNGPHGFLSSVCRNKEGLMSYLFSDLSFILTGNDNEDSDIDIKVDYEYDSYYKGN